MFGLFEIDYIEDYHRTRFFVAASHSRETLENYVAVKQREYEVLSTVISKYSECLEALVEKNPFLMESPPRYCSNRNARTAEEHKQNKMLKDVWMGQVREVDDASMEHSLNLRKQARAQAFESLGMQDDQSPLPSSWNFNRPEYEISEIVVLD